MPGALDLLQHLNKKNIPIALCTSSSTPNFKLKTNHLRHGFDYFQHHVVTGDDPRIPPGRGKPNPDIWYAGLESLNKQLKEQDPEHVDIVPGECLVFEDGVPGVQAGRAAGATVIWIPDTRALAVLNGKETDIIGNQGEILKSLNDLDLAKYGLN